MKRFGRTVLPEDKIERVEGFLDNRNAERLGTRVVLEDAEVLLFGEDERLFWLWADECYD